MSEILKWKEKIDTHMKAGKKLLFCGLGGEQIIDLCAVNCINEKGRTDLNTFKEAYSDKIITEKIPTEILRQLASDKHLSPIFVNVYCIKCVEKEFDKIRKGETMEKLSEEDEIGIIEGEETAELWKALNRNPIICTICGEQILTAEDCDYTNREEFKALDKAGFIIKDKVDIDLDCFEDARTLHIMACQSCAEMTREDEKYIRKNK